MKIEYIKEGLKSNETLDSYTIKAIAKEASFKTTQSFSYTFHKKTGLYPTYFIKELNKVK